MLFENQKKKPLRQFHLQRTIKLQEAENWELCFFEFYIRGSH